MKLNFKTVLIIVAIFVIGFGIWNIISNNENTEEVTTTDLESADQALFSEDGQTVRYSGVIGETALETLNKLTDVRVESSEFGEFVTGIGEVDSDVTTNFWAFYVNGEQANVGTGSYIAEEGDQIEWRLEEIIF